jgi:hypothetical protein
MRGRIVFTNPTTDTGVIFAADRNRYAFHVSEWEGEGRPPRNQEVDFEPMGDEATAIHAATAPDPEHEVNYSPPDGYGPATRRPGGDKAQNAIAADKQFAPSAPNTMQKKFAKQLLIQQEKEAKLPKWLGVVLGVGVALVIFIAFLFLKPA